MLEQFDVPDNVTAAIIGALSALLVTLIKDVILEQIRRKRESRKALIDRKLTQLYSPLWVALSGGPNALGHMLADDFVYERLTANFHLLSEPLKTLIEEFMQLGKGDVRNRQYSPKEAGEAFALQGKILPVLASDIQGLRNQYEKY